MRRIRKKYKRPKAPWYSPRIEDEKKLLKTYGLRRKKEIWRAQEILRNFRRRARELIAVENKEKEKVLINKLASLGMLSKEANLDDILALTVENILDRRLQTQVFKRRFSQTPMEARQKIVHGHVEINGRKVKFPSYLVSVSEETIINVSNLGGSDGTAAKAK